MRARLQVKVTLTLAGKPHVIPAGNVRELSFQMESYGVEGVLEFIQQDDSAHQGNFEDIVLADFIKPDLGTISLSVAGVSTDLTIATSLPILETQGVLTGREVWEEFYERQLEEPAVLVRRYRVHFADRARVLWRQHYPFTLYTEKTLQQVFDAERGSVELTYDWDALTTQRPMAFLGLDVERGVSFYDFVLWFLARERGQLFYDHKKGTYRIAAAKDAAGDAVSLHREELEALRLVYAEVVRSQTRLCNVDAKLGALRPIDAQNAAQGVYRDVLLRTSVSQQVDDRAQWETGAGALPPRTLHIQFARYPDAAIAPGAVLGMSSKGGLPSELLAASSSWRLFAVSFSARAPTRGPDQGYGAASASFELELQAHAESTDDTTPRLPRFLAPRYPGYVEGVVLSAVGADDELTYESKQDEASGADLYRVELPVFDKQEVHPVYLPELSSGTVYLPAYKSARVLVALEFDRCRIVRQLDWRPGARVAPDGQGQQVFLGKTETNNTRLTHDYQSEKPVFQLLRTNDKDTLLVRLEEGKMTLKVEQQDG